MPLAQSPSQQGVEMKSSSKALPLLYSAEVAPWDCEMRALSGKKPVVVVFLDVSVLMSYPQ